MKTIKLICLVLAMLFMLVGCAQSEETTTQEETSTTTTEVTTETTTETTTEEPTTEAVIEPTEVSVGETFVIDDVAEFTLTGIEYADKVRYGGGWMIVNSTEGNIGLSIVFSYKNLYTTVFDQYYSQMERAMYYDDLIYADKYTYTMYQETHEDVQPLSTSDLYLTYSVPLEVMNSDESLLVYFSVGDESYVFDVRSAE